MSQQRRILENEKPGCLNEREVEEDWKERPICEGEWCKEDANTAVNSRGKEEKKVHGRGKLKGGEIMAERRN